MRSGRRRLRPAHVPHGKTFSFYSSFSLPSCSFLEVFELTSCQGDFRMSSMREPSMFVVQVDISEKQEPEM